MPPKPSEQAFKVRFYALISDRFRTRFMQDADVFEKFKVLYEEQAFIVTIDPAKDNLTIDDAYFAKLQQSLIDGLQQQSHEVLFAVMNPGEKCPAINTQPFFVKHVSIISDGNHGCLLADALKLQGFAVETTNNHLLINVTR